MIRPINLVLIAHQVSFAETKMPKDRLKTQKKHSRGVIADRAIGPGHLAEHRQ